MYQQNNLNYYNKSKQIPKSPNSFPPTHIHPTIQHTMKLQTNSQSSPLITPISRNLFSKANIFYNKQQASQLIKVSGKQIDKRIQDIIFIISRVIKEIEQHWNQRGNGQRKEIEICRKMQKKVYSLLKEEEQAKNDEKVLNKLNKILHSLKIYLRGLKVGQQMSLEQLYLQLKRQTLRVYVSPSVSNNVQPEQKQQTQANPMSSHNSNLEDIHDTINQSKKLIEQLSVRNNPNLLTAYNKNIFNPKHNQIRQKINESMDEVNNKPTAIDQILYSTHRNDSKNSGRLNIDNRNDYLNVVSHMYGSKSKEKRNSYAKNSRKLKYYQPQLQPEQSPQDREYPSKHKKSRKQLENELNEQLQRNIKINHIHHYHNNEDEQNKDNTRSTKISKQLSKCYMDQIKQIDDGLKQRGKKKEKAGRKQENVVNFTNEGRQKVRNNKSGPDSIIDYRQQNKQASNNDSRKNSQRASNLNISSQEQQQGNSNPLNKLVKQITQDIENMRKKNSNKPTEPQQCSTNTTKDKYISYNMDIPQELSQLQEQPQKNKNKYNLPSKISQKPNTGLYSFRPSQHSNNTSNSMGKIQNLNDNKIPSVLDIPQEQQNQPYAEFEAPLTSKQNDTQSIEQSLKKKHRDYGIPLSQLKINKIISSIQNRIKLSPVVISQIPFENQLRANNNQAQIDKRFNKESKQRQQVIEKVMGYMDQKEGFSRYKVLCEKYSNIKSEKKPEQIFKPFRFDQAGNRMLRDNKIWRSPGKINEELQKFKALNSPILNGESCCNQNNNQIQSEINRIYNNHRNLLMCRSLDTLLPFQSTYINKSKSKHAQYGKFDSQSQNQQQPQKYNEYQQYSDTEEQYKPINKYKQAKQQCIFKRNWQPIQRLRKEIENEIKKIDNTMLNQQQSQEQF